MARMEPEKTMANMWKVEQPKSLLALASPGSKLKTMSSYLLTALPFSKWRNKRYIFESLDY
jgi:hypothetical protein